MLALDLDLNPRVRDIIKTALQEAKPLWFNITHGGIELWDRRALWMNEVSPDYFENGNSVVWQTDTRILAEGCILAIERNALPFAIGALTIPRQLDCGDSLICVVGAVTLHGKIPPC